MGDVARLTETFDGAVADISVSADAMRWSPRRAARTEGIDCPAGPRNGVGMRLVSRVVTPFAWVLADLADDARWLWRRRTPA